MPIYPHAGPRPRAGPRRNLRFVGVSDIGTSPTDAAGGIPKKQVNAAGVAQEPTEAPLNCPAMNRRLSLPLAVIAAVAAAAGPAALAAPPTVPVLNDSRVGHALEIVAPADRLASAVAVGNTYVGWKLRVAEEGIFRVSSIGAAATGPMIARIRIDAAEGAGGSVDAVASTVSAGGVGATVPGPVGGTNGGTLKPGDYYVVAAAPGGPLSAVRFVLSGPKTASVTGSLSGPAFGFTDADFGGTVLSAPGIDRRSVHGSVTISARHTLFASWARCPGATTSVSGPPAASNWPWAGPSGVWWGQPGNWTFTLEARTDSLQPTSSGWPCTNHLIAVDLPVPASAIPQR
jgi:hypothetical protein